MYWVGVFTAGMTAFYVFRAFFLAFFGEYRGHSAEDSAHGGGHSEPDAHGHGADDHGHGGTPHESPASDVDSAGDPGGLEPRRAGSFNIPRWLEPMFSRCEEAPGTEWTVYMSVAAGLVGIALAYLFYVVSPGRCRKRSRACLAAPYAGSTTSISSTNSTIRPSSSRWSDGSRTAAVARRGCAVDRRRGERNRHGRARHRRECCGARNPARFEVTRPGWCWARSW